MSIVIQDVLDLARLDVNDAGKIRETDSNWLKFANDGIARCLALRPDLNYGNYSTAYVDLGTSSVFPLPIEYRPAIAAYIVARAETADDPFVLEQRADYEMQQYLKNLGLA